MEKGFLSSSASEIGSGKNVNSAQTGDKSLFDSFVDYFVSAHEDDESSDGSHSSSGGIKSKSLALRTRIKQCLENIVFDYTPIFENNTTINQEIANFIKTINIYEFARGTKYFDDLEFEKLMECVYNEIMQGQIYAIFLLFELTVVNKDRIKICSRFIENLLSESVLKEDQNDKTVIESTIVASKKKELPLVIDLFSPLIAFFYIQHSGKINGYESSVSDILLKLVNQIELKYSSNYSPFFAMMHLKGLAVYYQITSKEFNSIKLYESVLEFIDTTLDNIITNPLDLPDGIAELGTIIEILLSPAVDQLCDLLTHRTITKIVEIIIKTVQTMEGKVDPEKVSIMPILNILFKIAQKEFKQDHEEKFGYIRQMVCLKGLQQVTISLKNTRAKAALDSLNVLSKVSLEMLCKSSITSKEIADIFKMILFPICEDYGKNFPSLVSLPLCVSEMMAKGFLLILEKISKTHDLAYIWLNTLKYLLMLIDKAHQVQAVEYLETMIERMKNIVMTMISMELMVIVNEDDYEKSGENQVKQLSVSSWKAINAFLPDLKSEIAKILTNSSPPK